MPIPPAAGRNRPIDHALTAPRRSPGFLLLVALANAGGVIAYLPVLTLLLPMQVERIAGADRLGVLTAAVIAGAVAASGANILFGWLSDRAVAQGAGRRLWVTGGLLGVALGCALVATAATPAMLVGAVVALQTGVNALLAPLMAITAEEVPDVQKGVAGGLLTLGGPLAAAISAALLVSGLGPTARFALVPVACALCVLPLLTTRPRPVMQAISATAPRPRRRDLLLVWSGRLLVQVAGNVLSLYLLFYFESVAPDRPIDELAAGIGHLLTLATLIPLPIAVIAGRVSDRTGRRKPFLLAAATVAAVGLAGMAVARDWTGGAAAFAVYAVGSGVFLALHAGFAMQLLPDPRHRGRDLGLLNLANTLPALAGPILAWRLATPHDFSALMLVLAVLTAAGGLVTLAAQGRQKRT